MNLLGIGVGESGVVFVIFKSLEVNYASKWGGARYHQERTPTGKKRVQFYPAHPVTYRGGERTAP